MVQSSEYLFVDATYIHNSSCPPEFYLFAFTGLQRMEATGGSLLRGAGGSCFCVFLFFLSLAFPLPVWA